MPKVQTSNRVTIMIGTDIEKKVRMLQALLITETNCNWSFSEVLNTLLEIHIRSIALHKLAEKIKKSEKVS